MSLPAQGGEGETNNNNRRKSVRQEAELLCAGKKEEQANAEEEESSASEFRSLHDPMGTIRSEKRDAAKKQNKNNHENKTKQKQHQLFNYGVEKSMGLDVDILSQLI